MQKKGKIDVTSENIFPIIKKYLYSDHEIFLRELISNAEDATQKLKTLSSVGDYKKELGDLTIRVSMDKKAKTITVSDHGIGMTAEEVEKYINQIAFSSATEFLEKYKNKAQIIGHFGLGFYSSFLVANKVEIITKSHKSNAKPVKWSCEGSPEYIIEDAEKKDIGTDVILHIEKDSEEFLDENRINELLKKYCRFLPVEIAFGKQKEWKDGKEVETDKDNIINDTNPLWKRTPADLKDEDYDEFYSMLFPVNEPPLFHIHLNVDYPFNLTGILYFPKIKQSLELQRNKIQLYANQVFVTDSVENIVPEFLTLLHGVIDSPDIPLNISRSYLQSDSNVKKISNHITKKVADKLQDIFKNDRDNFEKKWNDLKIFIEYGMLTDEKFYDKAKAFALLCNTDNKCFTFDEYEKLIKENQTDKDNKLVYLYSTNTEEQHNYIEKAKAKGYDVLAMEGQVDTAFINLLEQKLENTRFVRVDADIPEKLIPKDEKLENKLSSQDQADLRPVFESQLPKGKANFMITFEGLNEEEDPITITQQEFMRRMKEMAAMGGGPMGFYGDMPDSYNLIVNANHPLVQKINDEKNKKVKEKLSKVDEQLKPLAEEQEKLRKGQEGKKEEEIKQEEKDKLDELDKKINKLSEDKSNILTDFGKKNKYVKQLIDLALLANSMLKGPELTKFVKRSVELIK